MSAGTGFDGAIGLTPVGVQLSAPGVFGANWEA